MIKVDLIKLLRDGSDAWNAWRSTNSAEHLDISRASISGSHLIEADLSYIDFVGSNLSNCSLEGADFSNSDCSSVNFENSDLSYAVFRNALVTNAVFWRADLSGADLSDVIGLTYEQIRDSMGDNETKLPSGTLRPNDWLDNEDDYEEEIEEEEESLTIPRKVVAPLQVNWRQQKLIATIDVPLASSLAPGDIAESVAERVRRLREDIKETNIDRRFLALLDDVAESLQKIETRRGVFDVGFAT